MTLTYRDTKEIEMKNGTDIGLPTSRNVIVRILVKRSKDESRSKQDRDAAWAKAIEIARTDDAPGYFVSDLGNHPQLWRFTRKGKRGATYGRRVYRTRPDSRERQVGRAY